MKQGSASPLTAGQIIDEYFIEHRTKLLDVAAFLDRLDRAGGASDFRLDALREAILVLDQGGPGRVAAMLHVFSDPSTEPMPALDQKSAYGAFDRSRLGRQ